MLPSVESPCSECGSQGGFTFYFWVGNEQLGVTPPSDGELSGMESIVATDFPRKSGFSRETKQLESKVLGSTHK